MRILRYKQEGKQIQYKLIVDNDIAGYGNVPEVHWPVIRDGFKVNEVIPDSQLMLTN